MNKDTSDMILSISIGLAVIWIFINLSNTYFPRSRFMESEVESTIVISNVPNHWNMEMVDSVMCVESKHNPRAQNGSHCGCPQLNEDFFLKPKGLTCKEFSNWTCDEQISFAYENYWKKDAENIKNAAELWAYNLCPKVRRGKNKQEVLYCKHRDGRKYTANIWCDKDKDGCITITDLRIILEEDRCSQKTK